MSKIIEGLYYSESHEYVKVEGEYAYIGISDYAQEQLGNVVYVEAPEVGEEISAGDAIGALESVKAASDLITPISGEVTEINESLEDEPELVNQDAYSNWILKVKLSDASELNGLMDAKAYAEYCK